VPSLPQTSRPTLSLPQRAPGITCLAFKRHHAGTLRGFADLHLPGLRLKLFDCPTHEANGTRWVGLPAKPRLDRDKQLVREANGKPSYATVLQWDDDTVRKRFSAAAVEAVEAYDTLAFDGER